MTIGIGDFKLSSLQIPNTNCHSGKNIFVSGLTINNRLHSDFINAMNNVLKLDLIKHGYNFIENSDILPDNLWQDSLHLNNSGKGKLLNNFLVSLNKNHISSKTFIQQI